MSIRKGSILTIAALLVFGWISSAAHAAFVVTVAQVGNNVVFTGAGSLDTQALTNQTQSGGGDSTFLNPSDGTILIGGDALVDSFSGFSGPTSYGTGGPTFFGLGGDSGTATGDSVGINNSGSSFFLNPPLGYMSGAPLAAVSTFDNTTISGLGITPGTYVWTWGAGATADSFTLTTAVPEPASLALLIIPTAMLRSRRRRSPCREELPPQP